MYYLLVITMNILSLQEKRALIVRLKPVLEEMAVCVEMEKSAIELSTKICPRKLHNGAYEYVCCLDDDESRIGMTVSSHHRNSRSIYFRNCCAGLASASHLPLWIILN